MTILQNRETRIFSCSILRLIGYSLLLMAVVNISFLLIPFQFTSPLWEFKTFGAVVERMPFVLLGIVLVCYGARSAIASVELPLIEGLSWFSLIFAILLLLIIPLNISSSLQIYYHHSVNNNTQMIHQQDAIGRLQKQLLLANSRKEITAIVRQEIPKINISDSINLEKIREDILIILQSHQNNIENQLQTFRTEKRWKLTKKCVKWNIEAIITAILFLIIWKNTDWIRTKAVPNKLTANKYNR